MKKYSVVTLLACIAVLAGCVSTPPTTEAARDSQKQLEEQRRIKADHFGR
jgi:uncharacterized membrane protein